MAMRRSQVQFLLEAVLFFTIYGGALLSHLSSDSVPLWAAIYLLTNHAIWIRTTIAFCR